MHSNDVITTTVLEILFVVDSFVLTNPIAVGNKTISGTTNVSDQMLIRIIICDIDLYKAF